MDKVHPKFFFVFPCIKMSIQGGHKTPAQFQPVLDRKHIFECLSAFFEIWGVCGLLIIRTFKKIGTYLLFQLKLPFKSFMIVPKKQGKSV